MSDSNPSYDDGGSHCNSNHGSGPESGASSIASELPAKCRQRKTPQASGKAKAR